MNSGCSKYLLTEIRYFNAYGSPPIHLDNSKYVLLGFINFSRELALPDRSFKALVIRHVLFASLLCMHVTFCIIIRLYSYFT